MRVTGIQHQSPRWKFAFVSGVVGELFGVISGPIAMFAFVVCEKYLYGANPPGILLFISPIVGALLGALEGVVVGATWPFKFMRRRNLTIAQLMLTVAIAGMILAFVLAMPSFAVFIVVNALLLLPVLIAALVVVVRRLEHTSRNIRAACTEPGSEQCPNL